MPQDTRATHDADLFATYFPPTGRMSFLMLEGKQGNALDKAFLQQALSLHWEIEALNSTALGMQDNLRTLCIQRPGAGLPCFVSSVLEVWGYDRARLAADADPLATLNSAGKSKLDLQRLLGGATFDASEKITGAKALTIRYLMQANRALESGRYADARGEAWEEQLMNHLKCDEVDCGSGSCACGYESPHFRVFPFATRSFGDVFGAVVRGDVGLINGVFFIMIIYLIINLGGCCHKVNSRVLLSCGGIITIVLAGLAGYGISFWLGFAYTPMHSVLPFVLLGIGIDETFVIMGAVDRTDPTKTIPERISDALGHVGPSVMVTTLTDFIGFVISVKSPLPALSSFCLYAALSLFFLCGLQFTFFLPLVAWDMKRVEKNRIDCCVCLPNGCPCCPTTKKEDAAKAIEEGGRDPNQMRCYRPAKHPGGYIGYLLEHRIAPWLVFKPVAAAVLVVSFAFFGLCVWGVTRLHLEDSQRSFMPDDSYLRATTDKMSVYYASMGTRFDVLTLPGDYFASQAGLLKTRSRLETISVVVKPSSDSFTSWAEGFKSACAAGVASVPVGLLDAEGLVTDKAQYYTSLSAWLQGAGRRYTTDVVWVDAADPQKGIAATKISAELVSVKKDMGDHVIPDATSAIEAMDAIRAAVDSWTDLPGGRAVPYCTEFATWEGFKQISSSMFWSIGECLIVVFLVTLVTLMNVRTTILILLCVGMTTVDVMGCMQFWGLAIDSVSVIYAVIGIGLCVDYATHVGHGLLTEVGNVSERVIKTLGAVGADVIVGGVSTFLGVLLLVLSKSYVFRVMFQVFFLTVVIGLAHGLLLLPSMMTFLGLPTVKAHGAAAETKKQVEPETYPSEPPKDVKQ